jgi:hypothetical protein
MYWSYWYVILQAHVAYICLTSHILCVYNFAGRHWWFAGVYASIYISIYILNMQMWTHKYKLVIWLKVALGRVPFPCFICKYHLPEIQKITRACLWGVTQYPLNTNIQTHGIKIYDYARIYIFTFKRTTHNRWGGVTVADVTVADSTPACIFSFIWQRIESAKT